MLRLDPGEKLKQVSLILNSSLISPQTIIELPSKIYVDIKFSDPSIIKNIDHVDFKDKKLDNFRFVTINNMPAVEEHQTPKIYVDNAISDIISYTADLHEINRNRRDLLSVFNDQANEFDNIKLTNLDPITVNRDPSSHNELANKKYVEDSVGEGNVLRLNQTLQSYLRVSVENYLYKVTKEDKIQITDTAIIKYPNTGGYFLQNCV